MDSLYILPEECCGCGTCKEKCPKGAISMIMDNKGFYYPFIEQNKCIDCGLCLKVCDFKQTSKKEGNIIDVFALQHNNKNVLKRSSSGGAFTAISDIILNEGGKVYGAIFAPESKEVYHIGTDNKKGRDRMRGSKYVQSTVFENFKEIKNDLEEEKEVLFTGTPCQCAALRSFLKKDYDNLVIIDLICHGVPSNKIFVEHLKFWEHKKNKRIVDYFMRSKKYGYQYTHCVVFDDNSSNSSINLKRILKLFTLSMRPSCFRCPYASQHRMGDVTIGDLWEADSVVGIYDNRGTSIITTNSGKGAGIIERVAETCRIIKLDHSAIRQNAFYKPVEKPENYDFFWKDYFEKGYGFILDKYAPYTLLSWGYATVWRILFFTKLDRVYYWIKNII